LGRTYWPSRDPIGDKQFVLTNKTAQEVLKERYLKIATSAKYAKFSKRKSHRTAQMIHQDYHLDISNSIANPYQFIGNSAIGQIDQFGLVNWGNVWCKTLCVTKVGLALTAKATTLVACVTCLIPGEGAVVGDIAQCLVCLGGIPTTLVAFDSAIKQCKSCCDKESKKKAKEMEDMKKDMKDMQKQIDELMEKVGG